jgi:hypothetical protein
VHADNHGEHMTIMATVEEAYVQSLAAGAAARLGRLAQLGLTVPGAVTGRQPKRHMFKTIMLSLNNFKDFH